MSTSNKQANPYASAAGTYDTNARKHTPDQRELEGRVLLKASQNFIDLQTGWDGYKPAELNAELNKALTYNRQIWMLFVDHAAQDDSADRPRSLRSNISNLGGFIFKHMIDVQAQPDSKKLDVLININREIAAGLMTKVPATAAVSSTDTSSAGQATSHSA